MASARSVRNETTLRCALLGALCAASTIPITARGHGVNVAEQANAWPGRDLVTAVDAAGAFGGNVSGLAYQAARGDAPAVLWAVRNAPSTLYELVWNGAIWVPAPGREGGTKLLYRDGSGAPDCEGITLALPDSPFVYVATERSNDQSGISRLSVLRFDASRPDSELAATHEWNLTADLPAAGANLGLEAIAFYPDALLTARSFLDQSTGRAYDPHRYLDHGGGLFFVGVEGTGMVYAYALDHARGSFVRVASFSSGHPAVMDLAADLQSGQLWAQCDDTCGNQTAVLQIDTERASPSFGRFVLRARFARPSSMPNLNNEGIAFGPESSCVNGWKPFFWSDDAATDGHALHADSVPCEGW